MNYKHSTFQSPIHRNMKMIAIKDKSETSFNEYAWNCMNYVALQHPVSNFHLLAAECYASYLWKYKRCHHYFLDSGIADFCVKSVKELTEKFYKPLPEPESIILDDVPKWMRASIVLNRDYTVKSGIVLHFPSNERLRSVMIVQNFGLLHSVKMGYNPNFGESFLCSIVDGEDILLPHGWSFGKANSFEDDDGQDWLARLVFGIGLYIDAFPDSIKETGAYGQVATVNMPKCWDVQKSVIMETENKNALSPHYRRGHFRLLQDERYINKKGQSVFVKGTFVKGQAYEVE
jgi:hypothetical protein